MPTEGAQYRQHLFEHPFMSLFHGWGVVCLALSLVGLPCRDSIARQYLVETSNQFQPHADRLITVPLVDFHPQGTQSIALSTLKTIVVECRYASTRDLTGETLIPPTLLDFAHTFALDIRTQFGITLDVQQAQDCMTAGNSSCVCITLADKDDRSDMIDAAGRYSAEGYRINITNSNDGPAITITGAIPLGAWWGSRTLLQLASQVDTSRPQGHTHRLPHETSPPAALPIGHATDSPGWATRGMMLDAGRKFYPPQYLQELCAMMSSVKQNTLHLHLSDNMGSSRLDDKTITDSLYKAFRLRSDDPRLEGLSSPKNESYSREEFDAVQQACASRGVAVVAELESPGHALAITRWKPELALQTDRTMLNISHPDTIPTVKLIWDVFAPWMHSRTISLGADEYDHNRVSDYNLFVKELSEHVSTRLSRTPRIWATFPPRDEYGQLNTPKYVSIQHWASFEADPLRDFVQRGYSVLNSDSALYIVNKWSEWFPQDLDLDTIFRGDPAGGAYHPAIFDARNASNNPRRNEPLVQGHIAALWNDFGPNATVVAETTWAWRDIPALAEKQWGSSLTRDQYDIVRDHLWYAPGQNLRDEIISVTPVILDYDGFNDQSGNEYHAINHGCDLDLGSIRFDGECWVETPFEAKGRNYTLAFEVYPLALRGELFSNRHSALTMVDTSGLMMLADGHPYSIDLKLPLHTWTRLQLIGLGSETFLKTQNRDSSWTLRRFQIALRTNGGETIVAPMAFPAPLKDIGRGFVGRVRGIRLEDGVAQ